MEVAEGVFWVRRRLLPLALAVTSVPAPLIAVTISLSVKFFVGAVPVPVPVPVVRVTVVPSTVKVWFAPVSAMPAERSTVPVRVPAFPVVGAAFEKLMVTPSTVIVSVLVTAGTSCSTAWCR